MKQHSQFIFKVQLHTGVGGVDDGQGGSTFHDFGSDGNLVFDASTSTSFTYTAATDVRLKAYLWGQGGGRPQGGQGGYSYGTFNLSQGDALYIRLNYGGGTSGGGSGSGASNGGAGGGLAGIFSSATINQSNARLIAGGGGGGYHLLVVHQHLVVLVEEILAGSGGNLQQSDKLTRWRWSTTRFWWWWRNC